MIGGSRVTMYVSDLILIALGSYRYAGFSFRVKTETNVKDLVIITYWFNYYLYVSGRQKLVMENVTIQNMQVGDNVNAFIFDNYK